MRFKKKVCIVTGGGSGIGKATSLRLAREGGKVTVVDWNDDGAKTAQEILKNGGKAFFVKTDVSQEDQVRNAVDQTVEKWAKIDVVVNDAAIMTFKPIVELSVEDWDHVMAVNLRSVFMFAKYSIPHMKGGAIVNISSVHAFETTANVIPYATSKGGMEAFCRAVSQEYPHTTVRINCVAPGAVNTPLLWDNPNVESGKEKVQGEVGQPEDIAAAVAFLASDEAKFINGATLVVDGARLDKL